MKLIFLTPGSGETFYCENCLRDLELLRALRAAGHEAMMAPLYLPVPLTKDLGPPSPIFFGGLNVYLQQKSRFFRRTPRWLDHLLDWRPLLRLLGRFRHMTSANDLGETTLSMLDGAAGRQKKELDRLVTWLAANHRPRVVFLSNALLAGMVGGLRRGLGGDVKIACFLQDEDEFLDALGPAHRGRAWEKIAALAEQINFFIPVSRYYAEYMAPRLRIPAGKLHVVHAGLAPEDYRPAEGPPDPPVLGFLSPLIPDKGLDVLAEAFIILRKDPRMSRLRLRAVGGGTAGHGDYIAAIRRRLQAAGVWGDVELLPNLPPPQRREFLRGLSVLSVPMRRGEAAGLFLLEAMASGVPAVQPRAGACTEIIKASGGGLLCDSAEPQPLAAAIAKLLTDEPLRRELGDRGRAAVAEQFSARRAASRIAEIIQA